MCRKTKNKQNKTKNPAQCELTERKLATGTVTYFSAAEVKFQLPSSV